MDPYLLELEVERRMWLEDARRSREEARRSREEARCSREEARCSREEARADARFHFRLRLVLLGVSLVSVAISLIALLK